MIGRRLPQIKCVYMILVSLSCNTMIFARRRSANGPSVAIMLGFEGAGGRQTEIAGLGGVEGGELDPELVEVERGDLLVEMLGQHVNLVLVLPVIGPQLDLGEHLVGEGGTHHKARVAGGATQID